MRDLVLSILISAALLAGLFSAAGSIYVLTWIWFQRPYDFAWGFWSSAPVFQVAFLIALLSNIARGQFVLRFPPILVTYLLLFLWVTLSTLNAYNTSRAEAYFWAFVPPLVAGSVLVFATIHSLSMLKWVIWIAAGGIALNAAKVGVVMTASGGGHITDQISGFVGDNNVFGLVLCMVFAVLLGLRKTLPSRRSVKVAFYIGLVFVIMCIIYTKSRGAFLSLFLIGFVAAMLSGRPVRSLLGLFLIMVAGWLAIPQVYFDRLTTLQEIGADESAMGRVENWRLAWEAAVERPLLGVGPENHVPYNLAKNPLVHVRVAHSIYFQVLGEQGFVGLLIYLVFVGMALTGLWSSWRSAIKAAAIHDDLRWARDLAFWMLCGYVGYLFGSGLVDTLYIEFPWYFVFFGLMLRTHLADEVNRRSATVVSVPPARKRRIPR